MNTPISPVSSPSGADSAAKSSGSAAPSGVFALLMGDAAPTSTTATGAASGGESSEGESRHGELEDEDGANALASLMWADMALNLTPLSSAEVNGTSAGKAGDGLLINPINPLNPIGTLTPTPILTASASPLTPVLAGELTPVAELPAALISPEHSAEADLHSKAMPALTTPATGASVLASQASPIAVAVQDALAAGKRGSEIALAAHQIAADSVEAVTEKLIGQTQFDDGVGPLRPDAVDAGAPAPEAKVRLELALPPGAAPKLAAAFTDGMTARLGWMAEQQIGHAEIELHPADLGSIDVQLQIDGKTVRAEFLANTAEARQLLESSLPRLRDLLEAQGLTLSHAGVGEQRSDSQSRSGHGLTPPGLVRAADVAAEPAAPSPSRSRHNGVLSEYA